MPRPLSILERAGIVIVALRVPVRSLLHVEQFPPRTRPLPRGGTDLTQPAPNWRCRSQRTRG